MHTTHITPFRLTDAQSRENQQDKINKVELLKIEQIGSIKSYAKLQSTTLFDKYASHLSANPVSQDLITGGPIKLNDPEYLAYKKLLDEKKSKINPNDPVSSEALNTGIPLQISNSPTTNATANGIQIGSAVSQKKGAQLVVLGENHDTTDQAAVAYGIVKGAIDKGYKGQIIMAFEDSPTDASSQTLFDGVSSMNSSVRLAFSKNPFSMIDKQSIDDLNNDTFERAQTDKTLWASLPATDLFFNVLKIAPNTEFQNIDVNRDAVYKDDNRTTEAYQKQFVNRDEAMAIQILKLQKKYPESLIVCTVGSNHSAEYVEDGAQPSTQRNSSLSNRNDHFAEQMAILNGHSNVHTYRVTTVGYDLFENANLEPTTVNQNNFDGVITINSVNPDVGWVKPKEWNTIPVVKKSTPISTQNKKKN